MIQLLGQARKTLRSVASLGGDDKAFQFEQRSDGLCYVGPCNYRHNMPMATPDILSVDQSELVTQV